MKQQFFPQRLFMDMKRLIINRLVGLGLLAVGVLVSCSAPTAFVPVPSPNPWADDYTALSSMENYKQWGTYNVHDPACKKISFNSIFCKAMEILIICILPMLFLLRTGKRRKRRMCLWVLSRYANQKTWYIGILWAGLFPRFLLRL